MYVKKLKRKCSVRGCKCTDTYALSLTREVGNSVIICKSCLGEALGAIDDVQPEPELRVSHTEAPPLFFSGAAKVAAVEPEAPAEVDAEEAETETDEAEYVCPHCGQVCKSEQGLQKHIASKHKELV